MFVVAFPQRCHVFGQCFHFRILLRFRPVREYMVLLLYISRVVFISPSTLQQKNIFISTEI